MVYFLHAVYLQRPLIGVNEILSLILVFLAGFHVSNMPSATRGAVVRPESASMHNVITIPFDEVISLTFCLKEHFRPATIRTHHQVSLVWFHITYGIL